MGGLTINSLDPLGHLSFLQQTVASLSRIGARLPPEVGREVLRVARRIEEEAKYLEDEISAKHRNRAPRARAMSGADEVTWYRHEAERLRRLVSRTLDAETAVELLRKAAVLDLLAEQLNRDFGCDAG